MRHRAQVMEWSELSTVLHPFCSTQVCLPGSSEASKVPNTRGGQLSCTLGSFHFKFDVFFICVCLFFRCCFSISECPVDDSLFGRWGVWMARLVGAAFEVQLVWLFQRVAGRRLAGLRSHTRTFFVLRCGSGFGVFVFLKRSTTDDIFSTVIVVFHFFVWFCCLFLLVAHRPSSRGINQNDAHKHGWTQETLGRKVSHTFREKQALPF